MLDILMLSCRGSWELTSPRPPAASTQNVIHTSPCKHTMADSESRCREVDSRGV